MYKNTETIVAALTITFVRSSLFNSNFVSIAFVFPRVLMGPVKGTKDTAVPSRVKPKIRAVFVFECIQEVRPIVSAQAGVQKSLAKPGFPRLYESSQPVTPACF